MTVQAREVTINLDLKKTLALSVLTLLTIGTLYTFVTAVFAFDIDAEDDPPLLIRDVEVTDENDNYVDPSDRVYVYVEIEMADRYWRTAAYYDFVQDGEYGVIVTLVDGTGVPMYADSINSPAFTITPNDYSYHVWGEDAGTVLYTIPADAVGTWMAKVMTWQPGSPFGYALSPEAGEYSFLIGGP